MDEGPAAEIETARTALADARLLLDHGGSTEGVVNRLYYACFHAARAALYSRGEQPRSHGGVRTQFGQVVVLAGDVYDAFHDATDLGYTRYAEIINKLDQLGLIDAEYAEVEGRGRSRELSLSYDAEAVLERLE